MGVTLLVKAVGVRLRVATMATLRTYERNEMGNMRLTNLMSKYIMNGNPITREGRLTPSKYRGFQVIH